MATTTTKSKAKTKTTKKPAVKTARAKTASTKTTKTTPKAPVKATAAKVKAPAKVDTKTSKVVRSYNKPFALLALAFAALAGLAGFFMKSDTVQVFLGHLTKNELLSTSGTVLVAAARPICEPEVRWLLVGFLVVSAVLVLVRATRWQTREQAGVRAGVQVTRWVDFAVTGALMFSIVALLNGVQDLVALKLGAFSVILMAYFAWMYERENAATGKPARASLIGAQITGLVSLLVLAVTLYGTFVYGMVRSPWYAYAALAVFVVWVVTVARTLKRMPAAGKHDYLAIDKSYNTLATLAKAVFAVVLIVGLYAK